MSDATKFEEDSERVNVSVAVSPFFREETLEEIAIVGTTPSMTNA